MKIKVEIECETIADFHLHLAELKRQVRKEAKRLKLDPHKDRFHGIGSDLAPVLDDDNCYGSHIVLIDDD